MKPVIQEGRSDCFRACVASILELPLATVPDADGADWLDGYNTWLAARGLALVVVPPSGGVIPQGYAIGVANAGSPDRDHAVVLHDGKIVHDPSPLVRPLGTWAWGAVFAALDPAGVPIPPGGGGE